MKTLIWVLFVVLMLGWTGSAWVVAELAHWLVYAVAAAPAGAAVDAAANWPVPAWLALWVTPELLAALQAGLSGIADWLSAYAPDAASLARLVTIMVWVVWGLGALALLVLAAVAHWLVAMTGRKRARV